MSKHELLLLCWENLWRMKFRTILTVIGVTIGTASIIIMVSLGAGAQKSLTDSVTKSETVSNITVTPTMSSQSDSPRGQSTRHNNLKLTNSTISKLQKIPSVKGVSPSVTITSGIITVLREKMPISMEGIDFEALNPTIAKGRLPRDSELNTIAIGVDLFSQQVNTPDGSYETKRLAEAEDLLGKTLNFTLTRKTKEDVEETITYKLRVVGVLSDSYQSSCYTSLKTAEEINTWIQLDEPTNYSRDGYSQVIVKADSADAVDGVEAEIKALGLSTFSEKSMMSMLNSVFAIIQQLLGAIGGVSLLVACVGIVNTMTMSIYERTREIGIMKVIGASVTDIRNMFVVESTMIGFLGGFVGVLVSLLFSVSANAIATFMSGSGTQTTVSYIPVTLIIFAVVFSAFVGMIAGVRPAIKAANLSSLDAIRTQ